MEIVKVVGREILDSRGNPTVEADVYLADGSMGRAAVPSGASTGEHEAVELRDGDKIALPRQGHAQGGRATSTSEIAPALLGMDAERAGRRSIAQMIALDGTPNKGRWAPTRFWRFRWRRRAPRRCRTSTPLYRYLGGVNACLLPVPMMNILNGGAHADNSVDLQEFMIAPVRRGRSSPKRCAWAPKSSTR